MLFHEWFSLSINADNSAVSFDFGEGEVQEAGKKPSGFGFMEYVLSQPVKTQQLYAINSLYSAIKKFVQSSRSFTLDDFLQTITVMQEHGVKMPIETLNLTTNRVALSTAHSSKGKEWEHVFIVGAVDKKWGNNRQRDLLPLPESILSNTDISKKEKNEDDRRLFYVALTRASKQVYISYSKTKADGKDLLHSMFVSEIFETSSVVAESESKKLQEQSTVLLEKLLINDHQEAQEYSQEEREFFSELVSKLKLSVTALNSYLADPYEFMINSLLRVPRAKSPILSFGTAVHFALEQFYVARMNNSVLTKDRFLQQFDFALRREQLTDQDYIDRKKHGEKVLSLYYDQVLSIESKHQKIPLFVEKYFGGKLNKAVLFDGDHEIQLSGRIDRVELLDKHLKTIRVIDYKTGKPKSVNVINGKSSTQDYSERELALPETIRGRYQRQLVFYKLLAELDTTFPYTVTDAVFDFVEPGGTHKDKHIERSFTITDSAVTDLKQLIIQVMREIRELKFLEH